MVDAAKLLLEDKAPYGRVEPPCGYFGTCGGCSLQDLAYPDQLTLKAQRLQRALAGLGDLPPVRVAALEEPWRYRNKVELTFGESDGRLILGFHARRSFRRIVDVEDCLLLPAEVFVVARDALEAARASGLRAYRPQAHQGVFRYLIVRMSQATGDLLVCLMTTAAGEAAAQEMAGRLLERHPRVRGIYWGQADGPADVAVPQALRLLRGEPCIEEQIGRFRVPVRPLSFLQANVAQADRLYRALAGELEQAMAEDGAGARPPVAWDLFCGMGLVSLYLASRFAKVYGVESDAAQVEAAQDNARRYGITNVEFRAGRVETLLQDRRFWLQEASPDAVVVDPPRAGLHPQALSAVIAARPRHIAYISCNAQSLARDLRELLTAFPRYRLRSVQAFDMFPQTDHLETLAILQRADRRPSA